MQHFLKQFNTADRGWLICWTLIYGGFLVLAGCFPTFWGATVLRYTGVALTLVYAHQKFSQDFMLQIALALTLLADTILVVDNVSLIGVMVFCLAQLTHLGRLWQIKMRNLWWYVVLVAGAMFFGATGEIDPIFISAGIYGLTLMVNIYLSWKWYREHPSMGSWCAYVGFILFVLCDICVAGSYLSFIGVLPAALYGFANYFAWAFYYPSQIFISNSSKLNKTMLQ